MPRVVSRDTRLDRRHQHLSKIHLLGRASRFAVGELTEFEHVVQNVLQCVSTVLDDGQELCCLTEILVVDGVFE
jgi:hypothetical protein